MRRPRFSESQMLEILQAVEGVLPVAEAILNHGISRATYFSWSQKYGGTPRPS